MRTSANRRSHAPHAEAPMPVLPGIVALCRAGIEPGWKRALRTIYAAKVINFISAVVLFVLAVGNVEVGNVREFEAAVAKADTSKPVNMLVQRGELVQFVLVRPAR